LAAIAFSAAGVAVLVRGLRPPAADAPAARGGNEIFVTIDQLPTPARRTVEANVPQGSIREIEVKRDLGRTVYDVDYREGDRGFEVRVDEDGKLIWRKPS
jgi:hypothetical protein